MDVDQFLAGTEDVLDDCAAFDADTYRQGRSRFVEVSLSYRHAPDEPRRTLEYGPRYLGDGNRVVLSAPVDGTTLVAGDETVQPATAQCYGDRTDELPVTDVYQAAVAETAVTASPVDLPRVTVEEHSYGVTATVDGETVQVREGEEAVFDAGAQVVPVARDEDTTEQLLVVPEVGVRNHGFVDVYAADDGALFPVGGDESMLALASGAVQYADEVLVDPDCEMLLARP